MKPNKFSVPKNAKVKKIEFDHGMAQTGGKHLLGVILGRKLELTSPNGKVRSVDWNRRSFEDIKGFFQNKVNGQWSVRMYGQNIATPSSDYMTNLRFWGSVIYKRPELTISYTLE